MRCYSCNFTHTCNQWEFKINNINVPCMLTNPKDQDLASHAITKFHLISSLTFLKTNIQEASLFPRVNTNKNSHLNIQEASLFPRINTNKNSHL